ncbi:MAG: carbon-nitrogen hydrolase family protein [Planctomycetes bacterium]|nr:carbon-nitrogen hydrolase family protein [Planctomycetota bacterium]
MPAKGIFRVATVQFAVTADPRHNGRTIRRCMARAKAARADVVHFSECALSGYAGSEFKTWKDYPWEALREETESILAEAGRLKLWTVLGSTHPLTPPHKPHNSLYVIDPRGRIVDRYDKRFLTVSDLDYYSAGDHWTTWTINGVKCAALICFDVRFPELYREIKKLGVKMVFQSFYNARVAKPGPNIHTHIMRQTAQAQCGMNYLWMSANNSSAWYSSWPSVFIRPNGYIAGQLPMNRAGMMVNVVDTRKEYYDASGRFRAAVMRGQLHSGTQVRRDPRSRKRTTL